MKKKMRNSLLLALSVKGTAELHRGHPGDKGQQAVTQGG